MEGFTLAVCVNVCECLCAHSLIYGRCVMRDCLGRMAGVDEHASVVINVKIRAESESFSFPASRVDHVAMMKEKIEGGANNTVCGQICVCHMFESDDGFELSRNMQSVPELGSFLPQRNERACQAGYSGE